MLSGHFQYTLCNYYYDYDYYDYDYDYNYDYDHYYYYHNHNYNKFLKSDWLSTALISALIEHFKRTVRVMSRSLNGFFLLLAKKKAWNFLCFDLKKEPLYHKFSLSYDN